MNVISKVINELFTFSQTIHLIHIVSKQIILFKSKQKALNIMICVYKISL